ncbi:MAG: PEP-CTERM sorting domain-containing protein [Verrucomicrobiae bacterium]|nr:PEP-CTERM sorting domain-containing protein [Verrucomicrobiae bacterium]
MWLTTYQTGGFVYLAVVPEPEQWVLLIIGLGILLCATVRKKNHTGNRSEQG